MDNTINTRLKMINLKADFLTKGTPAEQGAEVNLEDTFTTSFPTDDPYTQHVADTLKKHSESQLTKEKQMKEEGDASITAGTQHQTEGKIMGKNAAKKFLTAFIKDSQYYTDFNNAIIDTYSAINDAKKALEMQDKGTADLKGFIGKEKAKEEEVIKSLDTANDNFSVMQEGHTGEALGISGMFDAEGLKTLAKGFESYGMGRAHVIGAKQDFAVNEMVDGQDYQKEAEEMKGDAAKKTEKAGYLRTKADSLMASAKQYDNLAATLYGLVEELEKRASEKHQSAIDKETKARSILTQATQETGEKENLNPAESDQLGDHEAKDVGEGLVLVKTAQKEHFAAVKEEKEAQFYHKQAKHFDNVAYHVKKQGTILQLYAAENLASAEAITGYAENDQERAEKYDKQAVSKALSGEGLMADSLMEKKVSDEYLQLADEYKEKGEKTMETANQTWIEGIQKRMEAELGILVETFKAKLSTIEQQKLKPLEEDALKTIEDSSLQNKADIDTELKNVGNLRTIKFYSDSAVKDEVNALFDLGDSIGIIKEGEKESELGKFKLQESADAGISGRLTKEAAEILNDKAANSGLSF